MAGLPLVFNNPDDASPSSSPMPLDQRDLPAGQGPQDAQLFSPSSSAQVHSGSGGSRVLPESPTTGLGLFVQEPVLCVDPQLLVLVPAADTRPATPTTTPTRRSLQEQGAQALRRAALGLSTSFVALACSLGNSQPANVGFQPPPHAGTGAAEAASACADAGLTEDDPGVETEVEDHAPSPAAPLPVDPLPLSEDVTACVQGKRGKKRAAGGSTKRASKRQRSSKSNAQDRPVEPESDADDGPSTSLTGRPPRKAAQHALRRARQASPPSGNEAAEGSSSCTKCWKTFGRTYDLDRHLRQSACANADKLVCRVCGGALRRSDAIRRHLMTTEKCVAKQSAMSPELLAVLGCPTPEERAEYLQEKAARKMASKKAKCK